MVGSAIRRQLISQGTDPGAIMTRDRNELDLTDQLAVRRFLSETKPSEVYLAAAKVGGIFANNNYPADFIGINLAIQTNLITASFEAGVKRLLFLGSSCIYPRLARQPITEDSLLTGPLEGTNEPYAVAKIAGIKLCESMNRQYGASHGISYRSVMPTNLYGPGDNYHPENSHVVPALIRRFHEAKKTGLPLVVVWGSGLPRREFLYVDDLARACLHVMNLPDAAYTASTTPMCSHINVGCGHDITIKETAQLIASVVGYEGQIQFDTTKPDGTPRKLLDNSRISRLGWQPTMGLEQGLTETYEDFLERAKHGTI
jgi:GDP-L-fucose synthase